MRFVTRSTGFMLAALLTTGGEPVTALEVARQYTQRGWSVVPVPVRTKAPLISEWQKLRIPESELPKCFNGKPQNIGVILGEKIVDVDLDHAARDRAAPLFLPRTDSIFGREGKPKSHWEYQPSTPVSTRRYQWTNPATAEAETIVELRSSGGQTVFPGSIHVSGEPIEWHVNGEPAVVGPEELTTAVERLAKAVLCELGEPAKVPAQKVRQN